MTEAQDALVLKHMKLVPYVVLKFRLRSRYIEHADLLSIGRLALVVAATTYDPGRGKFSTYAFPFIRWRIVTAI